MQVVEPASGFLSGGRVTTPYCTAFVWGYQCLTPLESVWMQVEPAMGFLSGFRTTNPYCTAFVWINHIQFLLYPATLKVVAHANTEIPKW